tara:strand:+ start:235 stop:1659 length:1425 start_codon:yes stop_codon:yes gene_type:complete
MSEQLGIGQIIKNFLGIGDDDKEPSGAVSSSLRPKARPEGLMSSPRPKARPEDTDDDDTPSTNEDVVTNTITMMNDYDDSEEEDGVPLDSANIQELLINPNSLYDKHSTTIRRLSRFGNEVPTVMKQKLRSPVVNDLLVDVTTMLSKMDAENRPPEEPEFVDVPKPIPVTLNNREIQEKLVDAGYNITVDGVVGPQTKKAIKAFQKEKGLKVDGVVGKNTTAALAGVPEITSETIEAGEVIKTGDFARDPLISPPVKASIVPGVFNLDKTTAGRYLELVKSTPAKLLLRNIFGLDKNIWTGKETIDETYFTEGELNHFKEMWNKYGEGTVTRGQQIDTAKDILKVATGKSSSPLGLPANLSAYYSVGDTQLTQNDNGDVIVKDMYDYNIYTDYSVEPNKKGRYPILETEEFEEKYSTAKGVIDTTKAYRQGKIGFLDVAHNMGFLLGSRDYKDSSKDDGTPMLINIGNPETWGN